MLVKLDHPGLLARAVEIISELVTEVRLKFTENGLTITAIDPANVAMVNFKLPKSSFSHFEINNDRLGINLDNLKQVLKRCGIGSQLVMETEENMLKIFIHDRIKRNFNLALIEIQSEDKELPSLEFAARVEIASVDLVASIEDCNVVSDACTFHIKEGNFIIEAKSLNSTRSEFSGDEVKLQAEDCKAKYSLEYLQKFMKGAKMSVKTVLNFASDYPLKMSVTNEQMELTFILAPRVETDD